MAFNLPDFLQAKLVSSGLENIGQDLQTGMKTAVMPQQLRQEAKARQLANELASINLPFAARRAEAEIGLKEAEAEKARMYGGLGSMSGTAKEAASLEILRKIHGEDSAIYQMAKNKFDKDLENLESQIKMRDKYYETADKRFATQTGKTAMEQADVDMGLFPGGGAEIGDPARQAQLQKQYGLEQAKKRTDPFTRRGVEQGKNINITLDKFDPKILTRYSGGPGALSKSGEELKGLLGQAQSPEYMEYQEQKELASLLAKQIRQLWGDSITVSNQDAINYLINPESITLSPDVAVAKVNRLISVLTKDIETFTKAANDKQFFEALAGGKDEITMSDIRKLNKTIEEQQGIEEKRIERFANGNRYLLTVDQAAEFDRKLKQGGKK